MNTNSFDPTKPCRTRDGRKVEILTTKANGRYPILGNIEGTSSFCSWTIEGKYLPGANSEMDLVNYEPEQWELPDPPHGYEWLRSDGWTKEMLPDGWRPYLKEEEKIVGDRGYTNTVTKAWSVVTEMHVDPKFWYITQRPLPAPKPRIVKVPLEPSDIPPGSIIYRKDWLEATWAMVVRVDTLSVHTDLLALNYKTLLENWLIKRPGSTTWEPCYKLINQPQ